MTDPLQLVADGVAALAAQDPHDLPDTALLVSTEALLTTVNQLQGMIAARLQVMQVRDVTTAECGRKTRSWLIEDQHRAAEDASKHLTVARALPVCPAVAAALLAGDITLDHARNIVVSVAKVPADIREVFEKELVKAAADCDPTTLGRFARELRSRLGATETAAEAEQRRYDDRWLTITPTFQGMHSITGMLDPASAATVLAAIGPLLAMAGDIDERTVGQRRADALVSLAERALSSGALPDVGGEKPHLVATIDYTQLAAQIEAAGGGATLNGLEVSPDTARMIACDAGVLPAVLGSNGEVLNLGRKQPTWSVAQRRALQLEDGGCRFPRCQAGLDQCQIHHQHHWAHGGHTDIGNGLHLCRYHHWLTHHSSWQIQKGRHNQIKVWRT